MKNKKSIADYFILWVSFVEKHGYLPKNSFLFVLMAFLFVMTMIMAIVLIPFTLYLNLPPMINFVIIPPFFLFWTIVISITNFYEKHKYKIKS